MPIRSMSKRAPILERPKRPLPAPSGELDALRGEILQLVAASNADAVAARVAACVERRLGLA